jgi:hypothetical protein
MEDLTTNTFFTRMDTTTEVVNPNAVGSHLAMVKAVATMGTRDRRVILGVIERWVLPIKVVLANSEGKTNRVIRIHFNKVILLKQIGLLKVKGSL